MIQRTASPSLPALTGVRGAAALWVLLYHLQQTSIALPLPCDALRNFVGHGWVAVDLFFILSGFVLMRGYGSTFASFEAGALRRYAAQRLLRVYPTATVTLLLILALALLDPAFIAARQALHASDYTPAAFFKTLALANRWGVLPTAGDWNQPTWSLSVELVGYLGLPIVARLLTRIEHFWGALLVGLACIGSLTYLNAVTGRADYNDISLFGLVRMGYCFVAGIALARASLLASPTVGRHAGWLAGIAAATLALACSDPRLMIVAPMSTAIFIFALSLDGGRLCGTLASRPVLWLGAISFPLYLVHLVPLQWVSWHLRGAHLSVPALCVVTGAYLVACLGLAWALHVTVERPTQRWARSLANTRSNPLLVPAPAA